MVLIVKQVLLMSATGNVWYYGVENMQANLPVNYSHLVKVFQTLQQLPKNCCNKNFIHSIWIAAF